MSLFATGHLHFKDGPLCLSVIYIREKFAIISIVPLHCSSQMSCRSRLFSMLAAVTVFCKSLKFKIIFSSPICRPRSARSRKPQSTPPQAQWTFCVDMDGNDASSTEIESPFLDNVTGIAPGTADSPIQETSSVLVEGSDSASSMVKSISTHYLCIRSYVPFTWQGYGSKIAEGAWLEGRRKDMATTPKDSRSSDILYTPLSPPPSHRNSRKADVVVGPDDFTHSDLVLCRFVLVLIRSEPGDLRYLSFPANTHVFLARNVHKNAKRNLFVSHSKSFVAVVCILGFIHLHHW